MVDLVVIGGGMAGLTAASRAAAGGASVVVVDRAPDVGGSARFAGYLWTAPSDEVIDEVDPGGVLELRRALVAGYPDAVAWARELGASLSDEVTILRYGRGRRLDTEAYVRACERTVLDNGGEVLVGTEVERLVLDGGAVRGVEVRVGGSDATRTIDARWTLLATGGFQGDPALSAEVIHPNAPLTPLRSNPWSNGGGRRLAQQAGAAIGKDGAGFYGHLVLADIPLDDPTQFANQSLYYSEHAIVVNRRGERFIDETVGDHLTAIAALAQPEARCLVIADQRVRDVHMLGSYVEGITPVDRFELCRRRGGRYAVAESLEDFDYLPDDWGYPGSVVRATIEQFNDTARNGGALQPPREFDALPLDQPPYYVIEAIAAITFTYTGALIDEQSRVLNPAGQPIEGLLAAGSDAGGLYDRAYAGGLAAAAVFGLRAAETVLRSR